MALQLGMQLPSPLAQTRERHHEMTEGRKQMEEEVEDEEEENRRTEKGSGTKG